MIKAAIFDIDGTLLDSMPVWDNSAALYLKSLKIEPRQDLGEKIFSMTLDEGAEYLKEEYGLSDSAEEVRAGVIGIIEDAYCNSIPLKPGMKEILDRYHKDNIPMALATTGDERLAKAALTRLGMWDRFCGFFSADALNTTKYEPDIYLKAAELMGAGPEETIVYEDVFHAVRTAKNAGFYVCAVYDKANEYKWSEIKEMADMFIE